MDSLKHIAEEIRRLEHYWRDEQGIAYRRKHLLGIEEQLDDVRRAMDHFRRERPNPPR